MKLDDREIEIFKTESPYLFIDWLKVPYGIDAGNQCVAFSSLNIVADFWNKTMHDLFSVFNDRYMFYLDNRE